MEGTDENREKPRDNLFPAEVPNANLPNASQKSYTLTQIAQWVPQKYFIAHF
jgi:hypothetical protein